MGPPGGEQRVRTTGWGSAMMGEVLTLVAGTSAGGAQTNFLSEIGSASWLANFVGSMAGVIIGGFIALFALSKQLKQNRELSSDQHRNDRSALSAQLKQDRDLFAMQSENDRTLFKQMLEAQRENARRERRRAVATELAMRLKPAADRLLSFEGLDVLQEAAWPDYWPSSRAVKDLEVLLYANEMEYLMPHVSTVLLECSEIWRMAHDEIETCIADRPDEYDSQDPRIIGSMISAQLMTGRRDLETLVSRLLAWEGENTLRFPDTATTDELNSVRWVVHQRMTEPLGQTEQELRLQRQLKAGTITRQQFDVALAHIQQEADAHSRKP